MTWFKVDDGLHSHPKWLAASPAARALWVTAGSWCAAQLTDGHVPRNILYLFGSRPGQAAELVRVGLWEENGDGWTFHDWPTYQPTATEVRQERERKASAGRLGGLASGRARKQNRSNSQPDAEAHAEAGASRLLSELPNPRPDPTRPTKDLTSSNGLTTHRDSPDDDDSGKPPPELPPIVRQAIAILASRDLIHRQSADHLPPVGNPTRWENSAYDRRIAVAWPLAKLVEQHPDWTAEQVADFAEPPPIPAQVKTKAAPLDGQQAAALAAAERHRRVAHGEACQACADSGFTLNEDGIAVPCNHQVTA
jgi:hypothetical protein